ncbi:TPA: RNA-binding protein [Candidatus Woesearchaeota archaeon]|nr:RNA-binding protein [Candidatus Woesearchaeota archaeon]
MKANNVCNSCNREINTLPNNTRFYCPVCNKFEIVRCGHCRQIVAKYTCASCGFIGPN